MAKNPIRARRESLGLDRTELANKAGISMDDLFLVEEGGHIVLSLPLATKLSSVLQAESPQGLADEYRRWKLAADEVTP